MSVQDTSIALFEQQASQFKPANAKISVNTNDIRRFVYDWFTHFEHIADVDYYLSHLDETTMQVAFPGQSPITTHAGFADWYTNLITHTLWNFHDLSQIQVSGATRQGYTVSFLVNWYGEVRADSEQAPGWRTNGESNIYRHHFRQTWTVKVVDGISPYDDARFLIQQYIVEVPDNE